MSIVQASIDDYRLITKFIKKNWSKTHILAKNKKVFNYFYVRKKKINFVFSKNKNKIVSLLGYIVNNYKNESYAWLALWASDSENVFSGVRLLKELEITFKQKIFVLGLSDYAKRILEELDYKIGNLSHYYFINEKLDNFKVIKYPTSNKKNIIKKKKTFFHKIEKKDLYKYRKIICTRKYRDFEDFKFKYIKNKFYKYEYYIINDYKNQLLIVTRTILVIANNKKVIRIIDSFGNYNLFSYARDLFEHLLDNFNIEYIDLLNFGIPSKIFTNCGMNKVNYNKTIVPNFFEPFFKKNKKIYFACHNNFGKKIIVFKGDGDQERPNLI